MFRRGGFGDFRAAFAAAPIRDLESIPYPIWFFCGFKRLPVLKPVGPGLLLYFENDCIIAGVV